MLSILFGTLVYRFLDDLPWSDSFLHACLVLGEHTPRRYPETTPGKIFAGMYVMYARMVFFSVIAILILPLVHRILHRLHLDTPSADSTGTGDDVG